MKRFVRLQGNVILGISLLWLVVFIHLTAVSSEVGIVAPGTTNYPDFGIRTVMSTLNLSQTENAAYSVAIDEANGYAYLGLNNNIGSEVYGSTIVKVKLGSGSNPPVRVGALTLLPGESSLRAALIDSATGYAYFATYQNPAKFIKVRVGTGDNPPTRVGYIILSTSPILTGVIDTTAKYAYLSGNGSAIVKLRLGTGDALPVEVGKLTTDYNAGEKDFRCSLINTASGHAWFGTDTSPGRIVKISLGSGDAAPTKVGTLSLDSGRNRLGAAVRVGNYGLFGTITNPAIIVKVDLGTGSALPTQVAGTTPSPWMRNFYQAVYDSIQGKALFMGQNYWTYMCSVLKVAPGSGTATPTVESALSIATPYGECGGIDASTGYSYWATRDSPAKVIKVATNSGTSAPTEVARIHLAIGDDMIYDCALDILHDYAYLTMNTVPGKILKVRLEQGLLGMTRIGELILPMDEGAQVIEVDPINGYGYVGSDSLSIPGKIIKIALGTGNNLPTRVGALTLNSGENYIRTLDLDVNNGYGYVGTDTGPGKVVKFSLGTGSALPTRIGTATFNTGEDYLFSSAIDLTHNYGYFGTLTYPGIVVKVNLGTGSAVPSRIGAVTMPDSSIKDFTAAFLNPDTGYGYFGTISNGKLAKIRLGTGDNPPEYVTVTNLGSSYEIRRGVIDVNTNVAYIRHSNSTMSVVDLNSGDAAPTLRGRYTLPYGDPSSPAGLLLIVPETGVIYDFIGANRSFWSEYTYSQKGYAKAMKIELTHNSVVEKVKIYSHKDTGNLRLGIYDNNDPKNLIWDSGLFANMVTGGFVERLISSGTPSSLVLSPESYWLTWLVDTTVPVASYKKGTAGNGFNSRPFVANFVDPLNSISHYFTDELWTQSIVFTAPPKLDSFGLVDDGGTTNPLWTNQLTMDVTFSSSGDSANELHLSEHGDFSSYQQITLPKSSITYTFESSTNEQKTVYARLANIAGTGNARSVTLDLDTVNPEVAPGGFGPAAGQPDPASTLPVLFTITFNEPVVGLDASAVDLSNSTTGGEPLSANVSLNGLTSGTSRNGRILPVGSSSAGPYTITVNGGPGTTAGNVVVGFVPGAIKDWAGNPLNVSGLSSSVTYIPLTSVSDWLEF